MLFIPRVRMVVVLVPCIYMTLCIAAHTIAHSAVIVNAENAARVLAAAISEPFAVTTKLDDTAEEE